MGGYGSGSWRDRGAGRCDDHFRIDLAYLRRQRLLKPWQSGRLRWSRGGEETGSVGFLVLGNALRLNYRTRAWGDDDWTPVEEDIPLVRTATRFGGSRQWFQCLSCRRRCRVLYSAGRFRCRRCLRLTYESQYEKPWGRAISRAQKVRQRLGGDGGMDDAFPPRPKGMHWRTYHRLLKADEAADRLWGVLVARWLRI